MKTEYFKISSKKMRAQATIATILQSIIFIVCNVGFR